LQTPKARRSNSNRVVRLVIMAIPCMRFGIQVPIVPPPYVSYSYATGALVTRRPYRAHLHIGCPLCGRIENRNALCLFAGATARASNYGYAGTTICGVRGRGCRANRNVAVSASYRLGRAIPIKEE